MAFRRRRRGSDRAAGPIARTRDVPVKPRSGELPIAFDGADRHAEDLGDEVVLEAGDVFEEDDRRGPLVIRLQLVERGVEREQFVGIAAKLEGAVGRRIDRAAELDALLVSAVLAPALATGVIDEDTWPELRSQVRERGNPWLKVRDYVVEQQRRPTQR